MYYAMLPPPAPAPLSRATPPPPSSPSLPILNCLIWPAQGNPFPSPPATYEEGDGLWPHLPALLPFRPSRLGRFAAHPGFLEVA